MRFSTIVLIYFTMGALMWGGGVIDWSETGIATAIMDNPNQDPPEGNQELSQQTQNLGGPITQAANVVGGGLIAAWNLIVLFIGFLFWPLATLQSVSAPVRIQVVAGGALVVMFVMSVLRTIRGTV